MAGSLGLSAMSGQAAQPEKKQPHIILIMTDQQRWDALGCAGNEAVISPNVDRLAADGHLFCNAYERLHDPLPVDLPGGDAQRDVGREAAVGDEKVLRDVPDAVLPCPAVGRRKWRAVDGDFRLQIKRDGFP